MTDCNSMTDWISVEDKLPEDGQLVLTIQDDGYVCQGVFVIKEPLEGTNLQPYTFEDDGIVETVIFWMPMPKLPDVIYGL